MHSLDRMQAVRTVFKWGAMFLETKFQATVSLRSWTWLCKLAIICHFSGCCFFNSKHRMGSNSALTGTGINFVSSIGFVCLGDQFIERFGLELGLAFLSTEPKFPPGLPWFSRGCLRFNRRVHRLSSTQSRFQFKFSSETFYSLQRPLINIYWIVWTFSECFLAFQMGTCTWLPLNLEK